jgi:predicted hydrocarbon binding protein
MISSTLDLPPRGNYFAEDAYLSQDLGAGTMRNRSGTRILAMGDDLLVATINVLGETLGEQAPAVIKEMGRDWGRRTAQQFGAELEPFYGKPVTQLPLAMFTACLTEAFRHDGWGAVHIDVSRYTQGLLAIEVRDPLLGQSVRPAKAPVEGLLAAFLAGVFSQFTGVELECVQTDCRGCGAATSRFVLSIPERMQAGERFAGRPHDAVVEELCKVTCSKQ